MPRRLLCVLTLLASLAGIVVSAPVSGALIIRSTGALVGTGSIAGVVTDVATTPEPGVCVKAIGASGVNLATTDSAGSYTISDLPPGNYQIEFDPSCEEQMASSLAVQFYDGQSQDGEPDLVSVGDGAVTGIDATLQPGSTISGTITNTGSTAVADVCVSVYSSNGDLFPLVGESATDGSYSISSLPYGIYKVLFDPTCLHLATSSYAYQYYNGSTSGSAAFGSATGVTLSSPAGSVDVNAELAAGASISGTLSSPGSTSPAGVCVEAITQSDSFTEATGITDASGDFEITNLPPATYEIVFDPTCGGLFASDYLSVAFDGGAGQAVTEGENIVGLSGALNDPATPVQITSTSLPPTLPSSGYTTSVQADDGSLPYQWSATGLPIGLSIDPATGVISGTTAATGVFPVNVTVVDSSNPPVSATLGLSLTVGQTPAATTTTTTPPATTTTTTVPKTKTVCTPKTKVVTTDKIEVKNGKRTVVVSRKTVDVLKTVAVKTTKRVNGKLVSVVTPTREVVKVCRTVAQS